jgi:hypothetical protein
MLIKKQQENDNMATRLLSHVRDYGLANERGAIFDRIFNRGDVIRQIRASRNVVGQGINQMLSPDGSAIDGFSMYMPALGISGANKIDPDKIQNAIAENQAQLYWKKNQERARKYDTVASRSEVNESLIQICNEGVYKDDVDEICSLDIDHDAAIGDPVRKKLGKIFRQDVLRRIMHFHQDGWEYMKYLLTRGRIFFEVIYDPKTGKIEGVNMLPEEHMIIVVQDNLIIGYRQMLTGALASQTNGKNYIDFSPNQILYASLGMTGPGGVNDPRSILEPAMKPYNQLNTIEDSVVMYRVLWGSEKLILKVDVSGMTKATAEKFMKDQAKMFSRRLDYNSMTGEVTNFGTSPGLTEHVVIGVGNGRSGSGIERMAGGEQLGNIDDLKFFKRNLVNSLMVPPGRITALAGDSQNYSQGKIGEVTQAEVSFARLVQRYQTPFETILIRLFVMVLNTDKTIDDSIKLQEFYTVRFKKSNGFQNFIDSEVWTTKLAVFDSMMKHVSSKENPNGALSKQAALRWGLRLNDEQYNLNKAWCLEEKKEESGEATGDDGGDSGAGGDMGAGGGMPGM